VHSNRAGAGEHHYTGGHPTVGGAVAFASSLHASRDPVAWSTSSCGSAVTFHIGKRSRGGHAGAGPSCGRLMVCTLV
jgi:hypothetical protein